MPGSLMIDVKGRKCNQCRKGIGAGEAKTFADWCPGCQEKLRLGMRTGNEPPAKRWRMGFGRTRTPAEFAALARKQAQAAAAAAEHVRTFPKGRAA